MRFGRRPQGPDFALPEPVSDWAARAGFAVAVDDRLVRVQDGPEEVRWSLARQGDGTVSVHKLERDQAPRWSISADEVMDVARFLVVELAPAVRAAEGIEPVVLSFGAEPRAGWTVEDRGDRQVVLSGRATRAAFPFEDPYGVRRSVDFTYYADLDWADLFALLTVAVVPDHPDVPGEEQR